MKARGTKKEVYEGLARKTGGGLTKEDLMLNSAGRVVSKKASASAKKKSNLPKRAAVVETEAEGEVEFSPKDDVQETTTSTEPQEGEGLEQFLGPLGGAIAGSIGSLFK